MFKQLNTIQRPFANVDAGLLVLRVWMGLVLFSKHGLEKILFFSAMEKNFPDPIGIGPTAGLAFALLSDSICSILVTIGIFTRFAAAIVVANLVVVFALMHDLSFAEEHAEIVFMYLGSYLAILIAGAGRYSVDNIFLKSKASIEQ